MLTKGMQGHWIGMIWWCIIPTAVGRTGRWCRPAARAPVSAPTARGSGSLRSKAPGRGSGRHPPTQSEGVRRKGGRVLGGIIFKFEEGRGSTSLEEAAPGDPEQRGGGWFTIRRKPGPGPLRAIRRCHGGQPMAHGHRKASMGGKTTKGRHCGEEGHEGWPQGLPEGGNRCSSMGRGRKSGSK